MIEDALAKLVKAAVAEAVAEVLAKQPDQHRLSYTITEAAAVTGCSEWDIRSAIRRGELHAKQAGERGRYIIPRSHLLKYVFQSVSIVSEQEDNSVLRR